MKLIIECSLSCHSYEDAIAVITTGKDKFYSNGLDLAEMESLSISENVDAFSNIQKLLARLLTFPMLTVAAINGISLSFSLSLRKIKGLAM